jgi:crotonobetainyl-CoA:carnitine CoA-transferase CaiB-like acyl-CoA transferase
MMSPNPAAALPFPPGALEGVRVLDLSRVLAGPWSTQIFGDLGADVIKVESPGAGDDTRAWGPPFLPMPEQTTGNKNGESAYYLCANRNKRSIAVDFSKPEGAALIRELAKKADIVVENFKLHGLEKYGLSIARSRGSASTGLTPSVRAMISWRRAWAAS